MTTTANLSNPKTSIVILNWNGKSWLEEFLPSVTRYSLTENTEVVVADNASSDDSILFLKENYQNVRLICFGQNYGFAEGYNKVMEEVEAEYIVLLNSDVEVTPGWLTPLTNYLDNHPETAAVQPKILAQLNKEYFEYAGAAGGFIDSYGYPYCRGRILGTTEKDKGQYDTPMPIFWATGACLMIRTKIYKEVGGLDRSFFAHMEEIDLCWRINARGYKIVCVPQSKVYHVGGGTLSQESPRKTFLNFRNNLLMIYKNMPQERLSRVMTTRLFLDYLSAIQFLLKGKAGNAKAVLQARHEFSRIKGQYTYLREKNMSLSKQEVKIPYPFKGLILIPYYIKGKKHFSQLS